MRIRTYAPGSALLFGALIALGTAGVAEAETYDLTAGDYLTEDEYKSLSRDEAIEYCEKLAQEIDIQNDNAAFANSMLSDIDSEISSLKEQLARSRASNDPLASDVADLEAKLRELKELPRSYTVVRDDFLIKISEKRRIYQERSHWKRIYRANRDQIGDPNLIFPDQVFMIPRGVPDMHTVREGESLATIAGYVEIYGDRTQWVRLYDANRGAVGENPDIVLPGTQLAIPR